MNPATKAAVIEALEEAKYALDISQSLQESAKSNHHPKTLAAYERVSAALAALRSEPEPTPEPDCSGGMPCTTCLDKKACQRGCRRQPEFISHEYHDRKDLRAECDAVDTLLHGLGLDHDRCRTEGGALNVGRILSLLKDGCTATFTDRHEIAWTDKDGVHHSMSINGARELLERFWDEWPGGWSEVEAEKQARAQAEPKCPTCNDNGMIGGPSYYAPDEGGDPCPDCATPSSAQIEAAAKVIAERMDYPWEHMYEQGRNNMRDIARAAIRAMKGKP